MYCLNPLRMTLENGVYRFSNKVADNFIYVPCGKCLGCYSVYSTNWANRITAESSLYRENCVITLTYDNDNLPIQGLSIRDYQLFIKRLRIYLDRNYNIKIRYFLCGEYGSKGKRPHYHLILFNWCPPDLQYIKTSKRGNVQYYSPIISKIWGKGIITVGNVDYKTAKYCAKYLQKMNDLQPGKTPPFTRMSRKPGIGYEFFNLKDKIDFKNDKFYLNGKYAPIPRYYLKLAEKYGLQDFYELKSKRLNNILNAEPDLTAINNLYDKYKNLTTK